MDSNRCCDVCTNGWGEGSIVLCALNNNHAMYTYDVCDYFSPLKEGEKRCIHYPPTIVRVAGTIFEMEGIDRHLIEGSVRFVKNHQGPLDVVVDLGAHVGTFSIWCAKKGATVYAYEPSDFNYRLLKNNIESNREEMPGYVYAEKCAVTEQSGNVASLRFGGVGSGQRSIDFNEDMYPVENDVPTISLSDLLESVFEAEGKIDYLKCDIEGTEWRFCDMDPETRELVGRIGFVEMSVHPLSNMNYFRGEDIDYVEKMSDWLLSCGLPKDRFLLG